MRWRSGRTECVIGPHGSSGSQGLARSSSSLDSASPEHRDHRARCRGCGGGRLLVATPPHPAPLRLSNSADQPRAARHLPHASWTRSAMIKALRRSGVGIALHTRFARAYARRRSLAQHTFTDGSGPGETTDVCNCEGHCLVSRWRSAAALRCTPPDRPRSVRGQGGLSPRSAHLRQLHLREPGLHQPGLRQPHGQHHVTAWSIAPYAAASSPCAARHLASSNASPVCMRCRSSGTSFRAMAQTAATRTPPFRASSASYCAR
jgi:hypothetical protein